MENLDFFKKAMADGAAVKVAFNQIDKENKRYLSHGDGFIVVMPLHQFISAKNSDMEPIWNTPLIGKHLGEETDVFIVDIDEQNGVVTCGREYIKVEERKKEMAAIDEILAKGDGSTYKVSARVTGIYGDGSRNRAMLMTENGIRLLLFCRKWSFDYIDSLKDVTKVGDEVEVVIYAKNNTNDDVDYLVSRMDLLPNPWDGIEDRVHKGDIVVARIVGRRVGVFNARVEGLDGIVALATFPDDRKLRLAIGGRYQCEVQTVYESSHSLVVRPFAEKI